MQYLITLGECAWDKIHSIQKVREWASTELQSSIYVYERLQKILNRM